MAKAPTFDHEYALHAVRHKLRALSGLVRIGGNRTDEQVLNHETLAGLAIILDDCAKDIRKAQEAMNGGETEAEAVN